MTIDTVGLFQKARAAYQSHDFGDSEILCRKILAANPIHAEASLLFALICSRTNRESLALTYLRSLIRREPKASEPHIAISGLLFKQGQASDAREHARQAIELEPFRLDCYIGFAQDLARIGCDEESNSLFVEAMERNSQNLEFLRQLADYLIRTQRNRIAIHVLDRILVLTPKDFAGWLVLGKLRSLAGDLEGCVAALREAVRIDDKSVEANLVLGAALAEVGLEEEATLQFERVLQLSPNEPTALSAVGALLQQQGKFEEARPYLTQSAELQPSNGFARYNLIRSRKVDVSQIDELAELEALAANPTVSQLDKSYLSFAAAKGWEDLAEYERSIVDYDRANAMAYSHWFGESPWDRSQLSDPINLAIRSITPNVVTEIQKRGNMSQMPTLVVGMPRSGTTLIEQIVSSHPEVVGAGELPFWPNHALEAYAAGQNVSPEALQRGGSKYLDLLATIGPTAKRVIDKLPHNFITMGLVCSAFPNAKVIHVRRNPVDNCLSIYTTAFGRPPNYSLRRDDIVIAYREYERMMSHWRAVFGPKQLMELEYEEVITNREATTRQMIDFLGLPWSDACLNPERNERPVHTASMWQVRQPIYNTSIGRWRPFEPWIAEFMKLMESSNKIVDQS